MRVLLTGASGFLGRHAAAALARRHEVNAAYLSEAAPIAGCRMLRLDLTDEAGLNQCVEELAPQVIIHAAADSKPEHVEKNKESARRINVEGSAAVARAAAGAGARLFYISTDLVFDGERGSYREEDKPNPLNLYSQMKFDAEGLCRQACTDMVILRLSLCYGWKTAGEPFFLDGLYRSLSRKEKVRLFTDQYRSTLFVDDAAAMIEGLLDRPEASGLFHMAGPERLSRVRFGEIFCEVFGFDKNLIQPVLMEDVPSAAPRPRDCSLDGSRLNSLLGLKPRTAREAFSRLKSQITGI